MTESPAGARPTPAGALDTIAAFAGTRRASVLIAGWAAAEAIAQFGPGARRGDIALSERWRGSSERRRRAGGSWPERLVAISDGGG